MNKKIAFACLLAGVSIAGAAHAQIGFTASLGSTGLGGHFSVPITPQFNARLGVNWLRYNFDDSTTNIDYDFKLKLRTFDALLDYFPGGTGFRITGGVVFNGNKIDALGLPATGGTYTLNGRTYSTTTAGSLTGKVDFRNVAPYLGIGWGSGGLRDRGWSFSADLGVMFQGSPRTSLSNSGCTASVALCAQLASDIEAENAELRNELDDFKAYPVLRIGMHYAF